MKIGNILKKYRYNGVIGHYEKVPTKLYYQFGNGVTCDTNNKFHYQIFDIEPLELDELIIKLKEDVNILKKIQKEIETKGEL